MYVQMYLNAFEWITFFFQACIFQANKLKFILNILAQEKNWNSNDMVWSDISLFKISGLYQKRAPAFLLSPKCLGGNLFRNCIYFRIDQVWL